MNHHTTVEFFSPIVGWLRSATTDTKPKQLCILSLLITSFLAQTACQPVKKPAQTDGTTENVTAATSVDQPKNSSVPSTASLLAQDELQLLAADTVTAKAERYQRHVMVTGTLQVTEKTAVQSTVNAQVRQVLVDIGSRVSQGQPLIKLDISGSQDQLAQAEAALAGAKAQANVALSIAQKNKILLEKGFVAQIEYERSVAEATAQQENVKARLAQLNTAKRMAGDTTITAPASGVIGSRSVQVGQVVAPNQPLMEIINPDKLEFAANVPSEAQSQLSIGQSVPFTIANEPRPFVGQVSRISPQVDATTRQLTIYVRVRPNQDNASLKAGMFATGRVEYGQSLVGVLLPMSAVTLDKPSAASSTNAQSAVATMDAPQPLAKGTIWVIDQDQRLRQQPIVLLHRYDNTSQYLASGVEQGTKVVTAQLPATANGKKIILK